MGLYVGKQKKIDIKDYTSILKELKGSINEKEAKILLVNFLRSNIGLTFQLLSGFELEPIQEIFLRGMFLKDSTLIVAGRGFSKSTLAAIFAILAPIFRPKSGTCIISANFRRSRAILEQAENLIKGKKAGLLLECFPFDLSRKNDEFKFKLTNNSEAFALPLNSEGVRGTRCSHLLVDEGLLISEDIQETILRPFLTNKQNFQEEREIRRAEDALIEMGMIQECDRISFPKNKYLVFSSASYEFQYLYKMYTNWVDNIMHINAEENPPSYFVVRASYEALPTNSFLDRTQIDAAKRNGGENTDYFKREYRAMFSSASNSYFNIKKLHECTVCAGDLPTVQLRGQKDCQYLLAIDPSYSASKTSDYFAMAIYLLVPQDRRICLVHTYGKAGGELKEHFEYLTYLLFNFDIRLIIIDDSGSEFITGYNESALAKERGVNLGFLTADFDSDDYSEQLKIAKKEHNLLNRKIVYGQKFQSRPIRTMNEHLQNQIEAKKVWFASPLNVHEGEYKKAMEFKFPFEFKDKHDKIYDRTNYIDDQDRWITDTKDQTALIEVKTTALGTLTYDLPQSLRRAADKGEGIDRVRKDHYTTLLLASWGSKIYFDFHIVEIEKRNFNAVPIIVRY